MSFPKRDITIVAIWISIVVGAFLLIPPIFTFFKPLIFAFFVALIISPIIQFLETKFKIKKKIGMIFCSVVVLSLFSIICYILINAIVVELYSLVKDLPEIYKNILDFIQNGKVFIDDFVSKFHFLNIDTTSMEELKINVPNFEDIFNATISSVTTIVNSLKDFTNNIIYFVFGVLFVISFTLNWSLIETKMKSITSKGKIASVLKQVKNILNGYVLAQIKLLGITFVIVFIGFNIANTKYVLILSLFIALLDMLPIFGTGTILGPLGVIAFFQGDYKLMFACAIIYAITFFVRRTLEPKFVGDCVGISLFASSLYMFIGFQLCGLLGLILGVPVGVTCSYLYEEKFFDSFFVSCKNIGKYVKEMIS